MGTAKSLDEADVGIACFVSSVPGFRGILKQRYADFIVNEVDSDGNVVRLSSFDMPLEEPEDEIEENLCSSGKDYTSEIDSFRLLCGDADADALKGFLERVLSSESNLSPILLSPDGDKSHRTEVHNFFKKNFKFLITDMVEEGSSKRIRVRFGSGNGGRADKRGIKRKDMKNSKPFDSRGSQSWPENLGKFLRFNLYKENKDTQEALGLIGKMLRVQQQSFGFAGTKDKRSVSTQRVTMFKQHAKRLAALNSRMFGVKVGDFCYVKEALVLGKLSGNRFTITLRGVVADCEDTIKSAVDGLQRNGFVNYYGLQRFGSGTVPTHLVGATLLRGEWKDAAGLILDPRDGERPIIREAREHYKVHGDVDSALSKFPHHLVAERAILQCLKKFPGNFVQALKGIPRTLRMMYVHSYQSYLWNHAASMRVQKYGISQVVLGDLVFCKEISLELPSSNISKCEDDYNEGENFLFDLCNEVQYEENDQLVKASHLNMLVLKIFVQDFICLRMLYFHCLGISQVVLGDLVFCKEISPELPSSNISECEDGCNEGENFLFDLRDEVQSEEKDQLVKVIDSEDLRIGLYTFEDVVLPLPGSTILYPTNDIANVYHDLATKDGICLTESVHGVKEFSISCMKGGYRRVFQRPLDFVWELVEYTNDDIPLVQTDLEIMEKAAGLDTSSSKTINIDSEALADKSLGEDGNEDLPSIGDPDHSSDIPSAKRALKLAFTLPTSCYATMAIRELLKSSTSVSYHKALNQ